MKVTHYGIRNKATRRWLVDSSGVICATASRAVAEAQFLQCGIFNLPAGEWKVESFVEDESAAQGLRDF